MNVNVNELAIYRDELREQAKDLRIGSRALSGDALRAAQKEHRVIMGRITQLNDAIRNRI